MGRTRFRREADAAYRPRSAQELTVAGVGRGALRGPNWRQVSRGFYTPVLVDPPTPGQRILDAVPLLGAGALGGWAAAYVHGAEWLDGIDPFTFQTIPVDCLGVRRPALLSVRYRNNIIPTGDRVGRDGVVITTPIRTAFDGARWASSVEEAVVFTDAMARFGGVEKDDLERYAGEHPSWTGVRQAQAAARLTDGDVLSPWESRLRCCYLLDAGLPARILLNVPIFVGGREIGWPDLFDPVAGLVVEFDGEDHRDRFQHHKDNIREEEFEDANLTVVRSDSLDLVRARPPLVQRMQHGYARGVARDRSRDRWTLQPPPGWRPHPFR